jgi:hypothetical protein
VNTRSTHRPWLDTGHSPKAGERGPTLLRDQAAVWAADVHGRACERLAPRALAREQLDQVPRVLAEIG